MKRINIYTVKQVRESAGLYDIETNILSTPEAAAAVINAVFNVDELDKEYFGVITLNTKNKINGMHVLSIGTLDSGIAHPRDVFKLAILNNAASVLLWHNHPSGDCDPSDHDIKLTQRLGECGKILGIPVLDHVIVGAAGRFKSLREIGLDKCLG